MALIGLGVQRSNRTLALDGVSLEIVSVGSKEEMKGEKLLKKDQNAQTEQGWQTKKNMKPHS